MERYCFVSDDDGHWYCIPACNKPRFDQLIDLLYQSYDLEDDTHDYYSDFIEEFGSFSLNKHISLYSFTNPREINE